MLTFLATFWYIWRARNDHKFNNKKWAVFQVHNAVKSDIAATSQCLQQDGEQVHLANEAQPTSHKDQLRNQGIHLSIADTMAQTSHNRSRRIPPLSIAPWPAPPFLRAKFPALLPGARIYIDASCAPDMTHQVLRPAGIGIFIVNNSQQQSSTIYIKASSMPSTTSVLMPEAAGLALAATMANTLKFRDPTFISDYQQLVNFIHAKDHSSPPLWSIKNYTQTFKPFLS